ncbi:MAG: rod shape-determining protein MreD, partial [Gammaproteobacteria bacterium]|nr:rod shape-determining protein MreD [Gammaproteobacteria bacterium]
MMNPNTRIVVLTMIAAFMLAMMPLPEWAKAFRPDWVTLFLIYWTMALPASIGVTIAWSIGLMLDVSHGALLGQHALGLVLVIYIIHSQHQRLRVASLLQQAIVIFFLLLLKQGLVLWVSGIMGHAPDSWLYFMPS